MSHSRFEMRRSFRVDSETSSSIHKNVSKGYTQITPTGERVFVPYEDKELAVIHQSISPSQVRYKHMKWTKTKNWKDQAKAKKSKWKYTPTFGGLNTATR
jgi:hypothetical protein